MLGTAGRQMLLKNLLITTLWLVIPVTVVYASTPLCGSSTAVVENWKGPALLEQSTDLMVDEEPELDELKFTEEEDNLIVAGTDLED